MEDYNVFISNSDAKRNRTAPDRDGAFLEALYRAVIILFLPWSAILMLFIGFWFILFVANFLLYPTLNKIFQIEEQIAQAFPEQAVVYEDDF